MPVFLLTLWTKAKYYILGGVVGLLGLIALIVYERNKGANSVREGERQKVLNASTEESKNEMAVRYNGATLGQRHDSLLAQRDQLRKLLQSR